MKGISSEELKEIAEKYGLSVEELREQAEAYETRPYYMIELAKNSLIVSAKLIGEIVERKRVERRMVAYQQNLRRLASQLSMTEERQRRAVAEGLHDEIIQSLIFLKMS